MPTCTRRRGRRSPACRWAAACSRSSPNSTASARRSALLDFVTHTVAPIVHAADDVSVMETLQSHPYIIHSTRQFAGGKPYRVGPSADSRARQPLRQGVGGKPRQRPRLPCQDRPAPTRPLRRRLAVRLHRRLRQGRPRRRFGRRADGAVRPHLPADRLRHSPISTSRLATAVYPAFHVVAGLTRAAGRPLRAITSSDEAKVAGLAYDGDSGTTLWLANLTDADQSVAVSGVEIAGARVHKLNDRNFEQLTTVPVTSTCRRSPEGRRAGALASLRGHLHWRGAAKAANVTNETSTGPLLGCIADDLTGATDLCNTLVKGGMRTVQLIGVPDPELPVPATDAIVVALKSRTIPAAEAVEQSRAALTWLRRAGMQAGVLQVLLDLRFDRPGQHRPGCRRAAVRSRRQPRHRLPGVPGERPHDLPGPPVRRPQLLSEFVDAQSSADADDRRQSGARACRGRPTARSGSIPYAVIDEGPRAILEALKRVQDQDVRYVGDGRHAGTSISSTSARRPPGSN